MVLCYGDSITKGTPGVSYMYYLKPKSRFKNMGLGGDTLLGLIDRIALDENAFIGHQYLIQIGTNDVLLPYLQKQSEKWSKIVDRIVRRGSIPCKNKEQFRQAYERLICNMQQEGRLITVINIPCIGENQNSELNEKVNIYNQIIKDLSDQYNIDHVDINGWQKKMLADKHNDNAFFISKDPLQMMIDSVLTVFKPASGYLSHKRSLLVTIDGCHLNRVGAKGLAAMIQKEYIDT